MSNTAKGRSNANIPGGFVESDGFQIAGVKRHYSMNSIIIRLVVGNEYATSSIP